MKQYEIFNKYQKITFYIRKLNKNSGDRFNFQIWNKLFIFDPVCIKWINEINEI